MVLQYCYNQSDRSPSQRLLQPKQFGLITPDCLAWHQPVEH
jgi:hypothetical protein